MSCAATSGRDTACFDNMGGVKNVYFSTDDIGAVSYDVTDTDTVATLAGTPEYFKYSLVGSSSSYTETINRDVNAGTSSFTGVLTLALPKMTKEFHKELKMLVYSRPSIIFEDYNGKYIIMGLSNSCDLTAGTIISGDARNSVNGYNLTFSSEEGKPAAFLVTDIPTTTATVSAVVESP